jgi:hypothetical protein
MERRDFLLSGLAGSAVIASGTTFAQEGRRTPDVIYVPTPQEVVEGMLKLAKVGKTDVVYDLGCGDGRIVVTAARQAEFANHLRLQMAVEDTGIGIREEDIRHLFGLFSKIRDKRVENPLGVGLGLAICKQLVELMRGQIHVVSEYGRGTKFFFNLLVGKAGSPQIEAHQRQAAEQRASTELISVDMVGKNVGRVLVVEDNEFNIEVVRCMLDNAGHTVGMAMNGVEGIEAWQAARERGEPYDAVLMDCNMPLLWNQWMNT